MGKLRARLTFANVVSVVSLLFALGLGGAWAATELSKNEVKSKHIGKGQVKNADIAANAVTSPKVANGSLLGEDFAPGQLPAGPQGEQGAQGERGLQGEAGEDATKLFAYIEEPGSGGTSSIAYGSGVVSVSEPDATNGEYRVTFDRSVSNCVVLASSGWGDPAGLSLLGNPTFPFIDMTLGSAAQVDLEWRRSDNDTDFGVPVDTSFLIAAFC
jgi:hypothetical protein